MRAPMLTWTLQALAAGADRAARRPRRPHPRDPAAAAASRPRDRQQPAHRREQPERASAAQGGLRPYSRQRAQEPRRFRDPARVLICRSPANSRNIVNRAEMIEALKPLGFVAIQPEKLSFDEQALTFAKPRSSSCEFGAAMTNVIFCQPGNEGRRDHRRGSARSLVVASCGAMLGLEHVVLFQPPVRGGPRRHAAPPEGLALRLYGRRAEAGRDGEGPRGVTLEQS